MSARGAPAGGPRTHQAFIVAIDGVEWLADTGFGGPGPMAPIRLDTLETQVVGSSMFRLRPDDVSGELVLERHTGDDWFALFGIDRAIALAPDFEGANFICACWDRSAFPVMLMMNVSTREGRASLLNAELKVVGDDHPVARTLETKPQFEQVLTEVFGLSLDRHVIDAVWKKIGRGLPS